MLTEIILCLVIAVQQWFWMRNTHKLLEKLMARDITEYKQATEPQPIPRRTQPEQAAVEDLSVLNAFSV